MTGHDPNDIIGVTRSPKPIVKNLISPEEAKSQLANAGLRDVLEYHNELMEQYVKECKLHNNTRNQLKSVIAEKHEYEQQMSAVVKNLQDNVEGIPVLNPVTPAEHDRVKQSLKHATDQLAAAQETILDLRESNSSIRAALDALKPKEAAVDPDQGELF